MEILAALFGGEPPALDLPAGPGLRTGVSAAGLRAIALTVPVPPPRRKVLEGLSLLWHDHWDAAHAVAQAHEGQADHDLLHAIGHRREGDYPNADYWFRSAGAHPALAGLSAAAAPLLEGSPLRGVLMPGGAWSTRAFTGEVRRSVREKTPDGMLVQLQALEMRTFAEILLSV